MLVKIKDKYVQVYKDYSRSDSIQFSLKSVAEPDECYLMLDDNLNYCLSYGYDDTYPLLNISKREITRKLKKLMNDNN